MSDDTKIITHENPAWRKRANFIIVGKLDDNALENGFVWEQLWARELGENLFEICCIPFFLYGFALGDIVETRPDNEKRFVIAKKLKTKGHFTLRIWFQSLVDEKLLEFLKSEGYFIEHRFKSGKLVSIDAPSLEKRSELEQILNADEFANILVWENGS